MRQCFQEGVFVDDDIIQIDRILFKILMTWVFDACTDEFGSCIRQYIMLGLSLIVFIFSGYSCIQMCRQQNKLSFQILPIGINTVTSFIIFVLYTQMEIFNTRIILLIVEVYSYFILSYGFIFMVFKQNAYFRYKIGLIKTIFIVVSVSAVASVILIVVLTAVDILNCDEDQGIGSTVLVSLQIPLFILTLIYSNKSVKIIEQGSKIQQVPQTQYTHKTQHLISQQDESKKVKILQIQMVRFAFVVTCVLHSIELFCYYIGDEQIICSRQSNRISITNSLQLYILCIQNISQLFPHFIIPFIFWFFPARHMKTSVTVYIAQGYTTQYQSRDHNFHNHLKMTKGESRLVGDVHNQEEIRMKLNKSPQRRVNRLQTL